MKSFIYEFYNGLVELRGNLLVLEEFYDGEEQRSNHISNGLHSTYILDVTTFKEKWEILKTDDTKEIVNIQRKKYTKKDGKLFEEVIFWDDFSNKVVYEDYSSLELAKEYGTLI